ncbi:MAG: polysaccharide deacetylase family protein [Treponema sp.]|nr:polysaccharide deacetylase family protein [Treponema sp.]
MKLSKILTGVFMAVLMTGCASNSGGSGESERAHINYQTREEILNFIDANWRDYGYSAKPDKFIALSFDDGPCGPSAYGGTEALLETLDALGIKAAFFVIGSNVRGNISAARAIYAAGHELGNHSDSYTSLGSSQPDEIALSLNAASAAIREITGENPRLFRAPNLNHGTNLSGTCRNLGMALIDGSAHNDWPGDPQSIKNSVLSNPRDGDIIILHENNTSRGNTMAVLPEIAAGLREKGFWFLTVSQLSIIKNRTLEAGARYSSL